MAEGIKGAACVICFMTQAYEDSANCKKELEFSQQFGVPTIPVLMQSHFTPQKWLGILTADSICTPMHDSASVVDGVVKLIAQVKEAVVGLLLDEGAPSDNASEAIVRASQQVQEPAAVQTSTPPPSVVPGGDGEATTAAASDSTQQSSLLEMSVTVTKPLLPDGKHAFLSYQWDVQAQVVQIKELLTERNVKCWMDIDGGMKTDIFDSVSILRLHRHSPPSTHAPSSPHQLPSLVDRTRLLRALSLSLSISLSVSLAAALSLIAPSFIICAYRWQRLWRVRRVLFVS
jgi:hypothetical protein